MSKHYHVNGGSTVNYYHIHNGTPGHDHGNKYDGPYNRHEHDDGSVHEHVGNGPHWHDLAESNFDDRKELRERLERGPIESTR